MAVKGAKEEVIYPRSEGIGVAYSNAPISGDQETKKTDVQEISPKFIEFVGRGADWVLGKTPYRKIELAGIFSHPKIKNNFLIAGNGFPRDAGGNEIDLSVDSPRLLALNKTTPGDASLAPKEMSQALENPAIQNRLRISIALQELQKSGILLNKLKEAEKNKKIPSQTIQAHRLLIEKAVSRLLPALMDLLTQQQDFLLQPQGAPTSIEDYAKALNGLFEVFYGTRNKPYVFTKDIQDLFVHARNKGEFLTTQDVMASLSAKVFSWQVQGPSKLSLEKIASQTEDWMRQTERNGLKNSLIQDEEALRSMLGTLKQDGEPTTHCQNHIKLSREIRNLLEEGKWDEAKEKYLGHYLTGRRFITERYSEYEEAKRIRHWTVGIAIVLASGGLAGIAGGMVTTALEMTGVSPWLAGTAGMATNGLTFAGASRLLTSMHDFVLNKPVIDPNKEFLDHLQGYATDSMMMGSMMGFLGKVVQYSRLSALLPSMERHLPQELLANGFPDLTKKEAPRLLAGLFEERIAAMGRIDRLLFKGKEFVQETLALTGWEMLEAQVHLLADGRVPSIENLKVLDAILDPRAMVDRGGFLAALKGGNYAAKPVVEGANRWVTRGLEGRGKERAQKRNIGPQGKLYSNLDPFRLGDDFNILNMEIGREINAALLRLGKYGPPEKSAPGSIYYPFLRKGFEDPATRKIWLEKVRPHLHEASRDRNSDLRLISLLILMQTEGDAALPILERALQDPQNDIRCWVEKGLGKMALTKLGDPRAGATIRKVKVDGSGRVGLAALEVLKSMEEFNGKTTRAAILKITDSRYVERMEAVKSIFGLFSFGEALLREFDVEDPLRVFKRFLRGDLGREPTLAEINELGDPDIYKKISDWHDDKYPEPQGTIPMDWWSRVIRGDGVDPPIFQIYNKEFLDAYAKYLSQLVHEFEVRNGRKPVILEIAAGDGRFTEALNRRGIHVRATDLKDKVWRIHFPEWVQEKDALTAAREADIILGNWWPPSKDGVDPFDVKIGELLKADPGKILILVGKNNNSKPYGDVGTPQFWALVHRGELAMTVPRELNFTPEGQPLLTSRYEIGDKNLKTEAVVIRSHIRPD